MGHAGLKFDISSGPMWTIWHGLGGKLGAGEYFLLIHAVTSVSVTACNFRTAAHQALRRLSIDYVRLFTEIGSGAFTCHANNASALIKML